MDGNQDQKKLEKRIQMLESELAQARFEMHEFIRACQQKAISEISQMALTGTNLSDLLDKCAETIRKALEIDFAHILELETDTGKLIPKAGKGLQDKWMEKATISAEKDFPLGYALFSGKPFILEDWHEDASVSSHPFFADHNIISGVIVIIGQTEDPYGVVGAYATEHRKFGQHDIDFLQSISGVLANIIERRQMETALAESEERYRLLFHQAPIGVVHVDKNGVVIDVNDSYLKMIGANREQLMGYDSINNPVHPGMKKAIRDALDGKTGYFNGEFSSAITGKTVFCKAVSSGIYDENGAFKGGIGIIEDTTDRKHAEKALRESEEKFRSLFESSRDAVIILEKDTVMDCNHAALKMFGCHNADMLIGKPFYDLSPAFQLSGADSKTDGQKQIEKALINGSQFFEWMHKRLDGQEFPAEIMLSNVELEGKHILQAMIRDITDRKIMEETLKQLASTDPLTGADNRRSFFEKGEKELNRSHRYHHPFTFLMIDVDYFKTINDTYGHNLGDMILMALVSKCTSILRNTDIFGRLGGEEFAAILPETDERTAMEAAERLRTELAEIRFKSGKGVIRFTVSIGLAMLEKKVDTLTTIMGRADAALYKAKKKGRNCVVRG